MAKILSFEEVRQKKFTQGVYIAPDMIEGVSQDIKNTIDNKTAVDRRRLFKVADQLIKSTDIPANRELTEDEQPPKFEYPPNQEK